MDKTIQTQADGIGFHDHAGQPRIFFFDDSLFALVWILDADDYKRFQIAGGKELNVWQMVREQPFAAHIRLTPDLISPTHVKVNVTACVGPTGGLHANVDIDYVFTKDDWSALLDLIDTYFKQQNQ